jgi:predicted nucleic acid-binding protein
VLIEVFRARERTIVERWLKLVDSQAPLLVSPVTIAELWHGARPAEYRALEDLFDTLFCVPIDREIGRAAGELMREYRKSHSLELADALIAAAAISRQARLWTRNRTRFPMRGVEFY